MHLAEEADDSKKAGKSCDDWPSHWVTVWLQAKSLTCAIEHSCKQIVEF